MKWKEYTPVYTKRWLVANLFLRKLMEENQSPDAIEWKPISEIPSTKSFCLIWAKDSMGQIFKAFHFKKPPHFYYANHIDIAKDITHFSYIGD